MISAKALLLFGGTTGAMVALLEMAAAAGGSGLTGNPVLDGLIGGSGATLAVATLYKYKVDRLEKAVEDKADRKAMDDGFARLERKLESIEQFLRQRDR